MEKHNIQILEYKKEHRFIKIIILIPNNEDYDPKLSFSDNFSLKESVMDFSFFEGIQDLTLIGKEPGTCELHKGYCVMFFSDFSMRVLGSKEWWIDRLGLQVEDHYKDVKINEIAANIGLTYLKSDE